MSDKTNERNSPKKDLIKSVYLAGGCFLFFSAALRTSYLHADGAWTEAHRKYNDSLVKSPDLSAESRQNLQKNLIQPVQQSIQNSLNDDPSTRSGKFQYPKRGTPRPMERAPAPGKDSAALSKQNGLTQKSSKPSMTAPTSTYRPTPQPLQKPSRRMGSVSQPGGSAAPVAPPPPTEETGTMTEFGKKRKTPVKQKDVKFKVESSESGNEVTPVNPAGGNEALPGNPDNVPAPAPSLAP